ncbi:uncharacterized protein LOC119680697 [Teleopsis dalmanni]|uniref:uncharacterized protein LOC119680697 n=1 Tax=Teleopsis dalmanni TaxID=139649 RepID=UPI0018CCB18B|nr:uncharacterized protein LOC119680697 [Teleopsis dalmanni]
MGRRTSIEKRELVLEYFKKGIPQRKIGEIVNISSSTVQHIIERFLHENRIENKGRKAPNKIFTEKESRYLVNQIRKHPTISVPKLTDMAKIDFGKICHPETVRRILRESNFNDRIAVKKPFVSAKNRIKRLQFAREHLNKSPAFWRNVLFADEVKINLFGSDGRSYVRREVNSELKIQNLRATVKHGGGNVMVWACMSSNGLNRPSRSLNLTGESGVKVMQQV